VNNLTQFANICLPETHPNNQRLGREVEDPDLVDYFIELKEFVNKDGFRGKLIEITLRQMVAKKFLYIFRHV
jgi:hypothetical protein